MGKLVGFGLAALIAAIVVFSVGFSSGLSWGGKHAEFAGKDAALSEQLTDEQLRAVQVRIGECLPVKYPSYLDLCLQGREDEWTPDMEQEAN